MAASCPPDILASRYRLDTLLGEGASGAVYQATDLSLGRNVAVKRMKLVQGGNFDSRVGEFVAEARVLARIDHPHIVDIHDVGVDEAGKPYFVMELVEQTLGRYLLGVPRKLAPEQILALLLPLCGALARAHDLGIVHCDLKPENIAVQQVGDGALRGKLLDFSIARQDLELPPGNLVYGTPGYMAPEQVRGEPCGPRTDVWALGAVAFQLLCGRLPYTADTDRNLLERTAFEAPPSLADFAPELPYALVRAIDRALAHSPDRRHADMRAFAQALVSAAVQSGLRVPADPDPIGLPESPRWRAEGGAMTDPLQPVAQRPPPLAPDHASVSTVVTPTQAALRRAPRHWSMVLVMTALALVAGAAYLLWQPVPRTAANPPALPRLEPARTPPEESAPSAPAVASKPLSVATNEQGESADAGAASPEKERTTSSSIRSSGSPPRRARQSRRAARDPGSSPVVPVSGGEVVQPAKPKRLEVEQNWEW